VSGGTTKYYGYDNKVQKKIDSLEEKYFITGGMSDETYNKFLTKYNNEKG
jgi:hypothetical protein